MRRVKKYSPNVSPPQGDSAILSALYARHFRVLRRRPNNAIPPYHQGFLAPSRALLLSRILLHHTSPLSHQQPTQQPTNRAQENIKKLESTVATANADIVELNLDIKRLKLIITCFMESIGKQRNLRDNEYAGLFKGADHRIDTDFVKVITTLPSFTVEKAEAKLEKAEAKIKEAKLELKEAKSGSSGVSAFKLSPNVVEAALPSMPATAYPMGALPSNMKEVDVVGIKNPYFEKVPSLYVRSRYYPPLWDEIKANILSPPNDPLLNYKPLVTIVIGQPGIGKSVGFGNYCVLRCMADLPKTIIIVISMETVNVLVPHNNIEWKQFTADTSAIRSLGLELQNLLETMDVKDHNALVVHDIKSAKGSKSLPYQDGFLRPLQELVARVHMVILTSPQESNYGLAVKAGVPTEKYLPVWSKKELECAGFDVQNKYEYCGGVPRSYANTVDIIQNMQANASRAFDARLMRRAELSDQCSSVLVQLDIAPDFNKKIGLSPVSRSAERLLRASHFNDVSHYFHDRVQGTSGTQKGLELERWFMVWIRGSTNSLTKCVIQNLSTGANSILRVSPIHYIEVEGNTPQILKAANEYHLQLNDGQSVLVQPKLTNFPAVDLLLFTKVKDTGVMWEVDAFQVTVSPSHAPTKASAEKFSEVFDAGSCRLRHFIWVGLTAGARSAGQNGGVTTTQKVEGGGDFFPKKQYRLDMAQVVPK